MLYRILCGGVLLLAALVLPKKEGFVWAYFIPAYGVLAYDVLWGCLLNLRHGQFFDEKLLMSLATLGAWAVGEYPETAAVMLFYQVGELFQRVAVEKSRRSIGQLMELRSDIARVWRQEQWIETDPEEVTVGERIQLRPGERVPLDGRVLEGESLLNSAALTGESLPREIKPGDTILSGCINLRGTLLIQVEKAYGESTVARILELVESSQDNKAPSEAFITRFARYYTPAVVGLALLLALIPPLLGGAWRIWIYRAMSFLVVSCPCALVISVPLSFFGGIGGAAKRGILVKGSQFLERLGSLRCLAFDKTGTLTTGRLQLLELLPQAGIAPETLVAYAASAEQHSTHPIARCIAEQASQLVSVEDIQEIAGYGVIAATEGKELLVGSRRLLQDRGIEVDTVQKAGSLCYVALDGRYMGALVIGDTLKDNAMTALKGLKKAGVGELVLLTGDTQEAAQALGKELPLDRIYSRLLPEDKLHVLEELMARHGKEAVGFVGDGLNDAPVLAGCSVGIAMGALGSDAAIEAADVVLMDDDPAKLLAAVGVARKTRRIVKENIILALGVKASVLLLCALGIAGMWAAVFADVGVAVLAILNALRCMHYGNDKP